MMAKSPERAFRGENCPTRLQAGGGPLWSSTRSRLSCSSRACSHCIRCHCRGPPRKSTCWSMLGIAYHPAHYDIVLPVGISFYTFATMSYTLDVYLRRAAPAQNLLDYALFVTFFPHLVAGPIMRPTELVPQFAQPRRASGEQLRFGLALMTLG